ncbi:hypothetical protein [uncultured Lutibacter sp.]|uniref:hypothetical protein n=1 Tax=uncultured Lutibacter sp. TaxID=437739 RepID=UPI002617DA16|nr:hypothetical protein [uncultured Lutibacter sp.]
MKKRSLFIGVTIISLAFTSCKDEKVTAAEKSVDAYVVYVDSISTIESADAQANWQTINDSYQVRVAELDLVLENLKEKEAAQARIDASKAKFEALKAQIEADMKAQAMIDSKQLLRTTLFGKGKMGDDMNFDWVNKGNIHAVYDQFVNGAQDNKDTYSREDWDEIKLMYEALDSRKNTVENEGLSSADNRKIALLKLKFAPMYTINRISAKTEEMEKAKS